ncbi:MAG: transcriptional regulator of arginine metabolism [Acidobacteriota bacterium]|jgi:transcriptional regulator of arginine metabolism|nr:transcriptional regulator of arginine metabolism [Acidobacteriota bacterium]
MDKEKRQQKLLSLIRAKPVSTQGELAAHLERAGFAATQSSISRDLEELGVVKRRGRYSVPRATDGAAARGLVSLDVAGDALVVARCEPGLASAVAVEIDGAAIKEIVGTIAGEDTIFVAVGERKAQRAVIKKIWELFG